MSRWVAPAALLDAGLVHGCRCAALCSSFRQRRTCAWLLQARVRQAGCLLLLLDYLPDLFVFLPACLSAFLPARLALQGFSTGLPERLQLALLHSLPGLEQCKMLRPAYAGMRAPLVFILPCCIHPSAHLLICMHALPACDGPSHTSVHQALPLTHPFSGAACSILPLLPCPAVEYDYLPAHQCHATLETKRVQGLFFSGQLNGTTGAPSAALPAGSCGELPACLLQGQLFCLRNRPSVPPNPVFTPTPPPPPPCACRLRGGGLPGAGGGDERGAAGAGAGAGGAAARVLLHRHPAG